MTETLNQPANQTNKTAKPDFGSGRYSPEMERIFNDCQKLFGIEPAKAEKIARQAGSDAGAVFRNAPAAIKVSKANGDGKATISDASKVKGVTLTNPLSIVRAIQWIGEAGKNGVAYGFTKWRLSEELETYVSELKV